MDFSSCIHPGDPEERRHIIIVRASGRKELRVTGFPCQSTGMTENKKGTGITKNKEPEDDEGKGVAGMTKKRE